MNLGLHSNPENRRGQSYFFSSVIQPMATNARPSVALYDMCCEPTPTAFSIMLWKTKETMPEQEKKH